MCIRDSFIEDDELVKSGRVEADLKAQKVAAKDIKLYIKPQDGACLLYTSMKSANIPIELEPPPTHATTASGSFPRCV